MRVQRGAAVLTVLAVGPLAACAPAGAPAASEPDRIGNASPVAVSAAPPVSTGPATACTPAEVDVVVERMDAATGNGFGYLRAVDRGEVACILGDAPSLVIEQGGRVLDVTVDHESPFLGPVEAPAEIRLEPRGSASAALFWRGYRNAADQVTPQVLRVELADGVWDDVALGAYVPQAPFDVVDGAEMTVAPWVGDGYGPPASDGPNLPVTATDACEPGELVAGLAGPDPDSYGEQAKPTATVWVAAVGVLPCLVDPDLTMHGPDGQRFAAPEGAVVVHEEELVVLRPGDGVQGRLAWADVEDALAAPDRDRWSVSTGSDVSVPIVVWP